DPSAFSQGLHEKRDVPHTVRRWRPLEWSMIMSRLQTLLLVAGLLHFAILSAAALVPLVLDWRRNLAGLSPILRQLVWVYGAFITLVIIGFGIITVSNSALLAGGAPLARWICAFIALFWLARLAVQLFVFDIRPIVRNPLLILGNHALTLVFAYFA